MAAAALAAAAAKRLELVTADNKSGYKNVGWSKSKGKYRARVSEGGKDVNLGRFVTADEAALAVARYVRGLVDDWLIPGRRATSGGRRQSSAREARGALCARPAAPMREARAFRRVPSAAL